MIPNELCSPLPLTKSVNVKAMAKIPITAINHETTVIAIEPVLLKMDAFLKNIPAPIHEPIVINITAK
jgi:hypothetical protein